MTVCQNCPLRLYNTKSYNLQGIGNPWYGKCILVPNVDYKAYKGGNMSFSQQVEIINEVLNSSTGGLKDNFYILPLIRCNETISCEVNNDVYKRCLTYFAEDLKKYNFKNILLLGKAVDRFLNISIGDNLGKTFISENNRKYSVNYSPLIKYVNDKLFETFKTYLIKWVYDN